MTSLEYIFIEAFGVKFPIPRKYAVDSEYIKTRLTGRYGVTNTIVLNLSEELKEPFYNYLSMLYGQVGFTITNLMSTAYLADYLLSKNIQKRMLTIMEDNPSIINSIKLLAILFGIVLFIYWFSRFDFVDFQIIYFRI